METSLRIASAFVNFQREKGNLSAHKNEYNEKYLSRTIKSFIIVMEFFNDISI